MKVLTIVGARPQFIKYVPVSRAIDRFNESCGEGARIDEVLVHSGQHYDYALSRVFFEQLGIREPDHHLGIGSGSHGIQTGDLLGRIERVLLDERPDVVVVFGDTNTTLAGALAAAKLSIPVTHIEAGLRSFNRRMPEEVNRVATDHLSALLFCPGREAARQLEREGFRRIAQRGRMVMDELLDTIPDGPAVDADNPLVVTVGDVMYDALLAAHEIAERDSDVITRLGLEAGGYALMTLHRAENTNESSRFAELVSFAAGAAGDIPVIFPMHPRTRPVYDAVGSAFPERIRVIDPLGYFDLLKLMGGSSLVLTDSGGMQKEAYWLRVPCVTLRDQTEWVETVASGWNVLYRNYTGPHKVRKGQEYHYGDGRAADRIVRVLARCFGGIC